MDAVTVLQTVLSAIESGSLGIKLNTSEAGVAASSPVAALASFYPMELPGLLRHLLSMSIVRDWLKFFLIGVVFEICRRSLGHVWSYIQDYFWISVTLDESDDCGCWLLFWLSKHKVFRSARTIDISTRTFGIDTPTISESSTADDITKGRKISFLPSLNTSYSLWYKYHYVSVSRTQVSESHWHTKQNIHISILARNHNILRELLLEAKKLYYQESQNLISVYVSDSADYWKIMCTQPKRPMKSIILDPGVIELVLNDAKDFLASKDWYAARGIPHRRGYLLYGAPGAGKTSLIHSLAGELKLNVYILSLTRIGLDDASLNSTIAELPYECIVLIEDIDAAFHQGIKRNIADPEKTRADEDPSKPPPKPTEEKPAEVKARISLSGLLNALDGIGAQEGRILFATTNDYRALDPALCRPGRLDLHIEFKLASKYQCRELFRRFYLPPSSDDASEEGQQEQDGAGATVEDKDGDSGYGSRTQSVEGDAEPEGEAAERVPLKVDGGDAAPSVHGQSHVGRAPKLSARQAAELADQFAAAIPHRSLSMATLQGYLMTYKTRPHDAVADVAAWVERKLLEKEVGARSDAPLAGPTPTSSKDDGPRSDASGDAAAAASSSSAPAPLATQPASFDAAATLVSKSESVSQPAALLPAEAEDGEKMVVENASAGA